MGTTSVRGWRWGVPILLGLFFGEAAPAWAVDGDAYWGPNGLAAAGPEEFFASQPRANDTAATSSPSALHPILREAVALELASVAAVVERALSQAFNSPYPADELLLTLCCAPRVVVLLGARAAPAADSSGNVQTTPFWLGIHVAIHSWCLAAILPTALFGARYTRGGSMKRVVDVAFASALGSATTSQVLPAPSDAHAVRYDTASGVFALAPAVALIVVAIRRTCGRIKWQRENTKEKNELPTRGLLGQPAGTPDQIHREPHAGGWQRWEVWALLCACGAAQAPKLLKALVSK